jgi:hypothetical protein
LRAKYLRRRYGIDIERLERMLRAQGGACAICRRPWERCPRPKATHLDQGLFLHYLFVDHDHRTGEVRGLLCNACNTAIGLFEERAERFVAAVEYIARFTDVHQAQSVGAGWAQRQQAATALAPSAPGRKSEGRVRDAAFASSLFGAG